MWPPCRNILVKILKTFCCSSGNEEKLISLPKNFFLKNFVWTCTTNFWQACRNHACKSTKDLFRSKSENDSNAKFSKRSNFSFISLLQKLKKNFIWARGMRLWTPCPKILVKILKTVGSNSGNDEKFGRFPIKVVSPQNVRLTSTMKFWQAWRNFVAKKRKSFPNSKNVEVTIFWTIFFHQKWFFSNGECNLDNGSKKFFSESPQLLQRRFRKRRKSQEFFEMIIKFLKMFLCTCRMQLWQPCQKFLVKTLKTLCSNSGND